MKKAVIGFLMGSLLLISVPGFGFGGDYPSGIKKTIKQHFGWVFSGKYEKAYSILSTATKQGLTEFRYRRELEDLVEQAPWMEDIYDRANYKIIDVEIVPPFAYVTVKLSMPDPEPVIVAFMEDKEDISEEALKQYAAQIHELVIEALEEDELEDMSYEEVIELIKENDQWRIELY